MRLRSECSPLNLLRIFRTPFRKNTSGGLLLYFIILNTVFVFCYNLQAQIIPWRTLSCLSENEKSVQNYLI